MTFLDEVPWNGEGLIAAVAQDAKSNRVLTVAWMNREALKQTVEKRQAVYWSRSRRRLWRKGEQSGHVQQVLEVRLDCDADAVLLKVEQVGGIFASAHTHAAQDDSLARRHSSVASQDRSRDQARRQHRPACQRRACQELPPAH